MPGRWCGRGGFNAGQVARPGCPRDNDPPRCAGNLAFVTLAPPMSRKRGWAKGPWASQYSFGEPVHWASQYSLGEPVLIGRAIKQGWASQYSLGKPVLRAVPARRQKCPLGYPAHAT